MDSIKVTNLASKALTAAGKISPILGAFQGWFQPALNEPGVGWKGLPMFVIHRLQAGIGSGKIANPLKTTMLALEHPHLYPIVSGATAALGGWALEAVGDAIDISSVGRLGTVAKKYGVAAATNAVVSAWFWLAQFNPEGGQKFSRGIPGPGMAGYTRGAQARQPDTLYATKGTAQIRNAAGPVGAGPR